MLRLNSFNFSKEIQSIKELSDEVEKNIRIELIHEIIDKINEYNDHISSYEYTQKRQEIVNRGVKFIPQLKPSTVKSNWSKLFATTVSESDLKEICYKDFHWHIFSYKKVSALSNLKARQAFNRCKKENVYIFYQNKEEAYYIENPQLLKSTDFDLDDDIYIFDTARKWTYVHTHESECGPYFYRL